MIITTLKLGKMKTTELAAWFGISYGSFRNVKKEKLEELKQYAEFEEIYGGVNILKILDKDNIIYVKNGKENYDIIKNSFNKTWSKNGLDSCSNVAVKIYDKHRNELTITDSTAYKYTLKARNELYGFPFITIGTLGTCTKIWCKREYSEEENTINYIEFTDEEQKIKKDLMNKYFKTDVEKEVIVAQMVDAGEISKEEAYDILCDMKNLNNSSFMAFKYELEEKLGCQIVQATLLQRNEDRIEFEETNLLN